MKILFFNYEYPPLGGGAGNATFYILKEYAKIPELEVDFVTSSVDSEYHLEKIGENIHIHRLPIGKNSSNLHFQSQKDLLVYAWKAFFFSRKLIRKNRYDLSHSFFTVPCGFLSMVYYWLYKIPYVVSLRGSDVPGYSERFSLIYGTLKPIVWLIWKNSAAVVSNSEELKNLALKTRSKQEISIIYNGIATDEFFPDTSKRPADKFIITLGGTRITARKGIDYLIRAIAKLSHEFPNLYLKILGEGDQKENLEKLSAELGLQKNIEFAGRVAHEKIATYYQESSLFVLPSLNEGMSNAMLEALAAGLPIISTDTGGAKELVKESRNGFIIKMKDTDDLAEKIKKIAGNPEMAKQMGEESRQIAQQLSWKNVAEKYYDLYKIIK